MKDKTKSWRLC